MNRVVVLHLITELSVGGAQTALIRFLSYIDRSLFQPVVVCLYNGDGISAQRIRDLGIMVIDLGMREKFRLDACWRLYHILCHQRPVILHAWMFHANLLGRVCGRLAAVPIIITSRRNVNIGGTKREQLKRWTRHLDDKIIAVCELARQAEIARTKAPASKVVTIYNGIETAEFASTDANPASEIRQSFNISPEVLLIGAIGRLHPQKNFTGLLQAFKEVYSCIPIGHLLLVGSGELRQDLEAQARDLALMQQITFAGTRSDVPEILNALDLFVLSSSWEGMPNVVLEAMAAQLPVVATKVGGVPEIVVDNVTGLLVPPDDPNVLARAIIHLLSNPDKRDQMGLAGQQRVISHFDIKTMVQNTQALYFELLRDKMSG